MAMATKAAAKVAGKAKGVAKALAGYPKIFHHLAAEHAELSTLLKRVSESGNNFRVREELFPEICKNLLAHAHAEEQEFYPVLRGFAELQTLVSQCAEEHSRIEAFVDNLEATDITTAAWASLFDRLVNAVMQHVEREENALFPKAAELVSSEQSDEMYTSYDAVEEHEKERLTPQHQHG